MLIVDIKKRGLYSEVSCNRIEATEVIELHKTKKKNNNYAKGKKMEAKLFSYGICACDLLHLIEEKNKLPGFLRMLHLIEK